MTCMEIHSYEDGIIAIQQHLQKFKQSESYFHFRKTNIGDMLLFLRGKQSYVRLIPKTKNDKTLACFLEKYDLFRNPHACLEYRMPRWCPRTFLLGMLEDAYCSSPCPMCELTLVTSKRLRLCIDCQIIKEHLSAMKIQRMFRTVVGDPSYLLCRRRLLREFQELCVTHNGCC